MKKGVKEVSLDGCTVTVEYEDGGVGVVNFTDPQAALDYCAYFGGRPKKEEPDPKKESPKGKAKKK